MKTKLFLVLLFCYSLSSAQKMENLWYFNVSGGMAQTYGNMTQPNPGHLIYNGSWSMALDFTQYTIEGKGLKKGIFGFGFGYQFHINSLDASDLKNVEPEPESYTLHKRTQLLHGPYFKVEYTLNTAFAPYLGLGAHLTAVRGAQFDLNFSPQNNFVQQAKYEGSNWGRINPSISAYGGLRWVFKNRWALGMCYEIYLRDVWSVKYNVTGVPATSSLEETEESFILTQKGWNQHVELKLQMPLR